MSDRTQQYTRGGYAQPGSASGYRTGTWRTQRPVHVPGIAPCRHDCPAGENPQQYLARINEGQVQEAWKMLVAINPLPAITGRVCPHPCETVCNRATFDEAVSIHQIERFLGDRALAENWPYPVNALPPRDASHVAVVGAGPAGLSCAWHLLRQGNQVTLFDSQSRAGGTCASAIPPYRLPREVVEQETDRLIALPGLEFRARQQLGQDFSLEELKKEYAAVFLGIGAQYPTAWSVNGRIPPDLRPGLSLLKEWLSIGHIPAPKRVAVIGGGNTAVDICRVLKRAGAAEVYLITHDSPPGLAPDAMPALAREVEHAQQEGIHLWTHRGVTDLILQGDQVIGLELVRMKKIPDAEGHLRRIPFEGTEEELHVDMVVPATGEEVNRSGLEELLADGTFLAADCCGMTRETGVYTGGDATTRGGTVSAAIGAGRIAAAAIVRQMSGGSSQAQTVTEPISLDNLNLAYFETTKREIAAVVPVHDRTAEMEIDQGFDAAQMSHEAARCFSCGDCLTCDNCFTLCPDVSVLKTEEPTPDGSPYVFDYDYCKGCGLCAKECPTGFIRMIPEP